MHCSIVKIAFRFFDCFSGLLRALSSVFTASLIIVSISLYTFISRFLSSQ